jgi:hypothetical protein
VDWRIAQRNAAVVRFQEKMSKKERYIVMGWRFFRGTVVRGVSTSLSENSYLPALAHRKGFSLAGIENAP